MCNYLYMYIVNYLCMYCFLLYMIMYIYIICTYIKNTLHVFITSGFIHVYLTLFFVCLFISLFICFFLSLFVGLFLCLFVSSFVCCVFVCWWVFSCEFFINWQSSKQFQPQPDRDWLISASGQSDYGWCRIACASTDNIAAFASLTQWLYFMSYTSRLVTYLLKFCWDASIESIYA
jgi:hypothetical protein